MRLTCPRAVADLDDRAEHLANRSTPLLKPSSVHRSTPLLKRRGGKVEKQGFMCLKREGGGVFVVVQRRESACRWRRSGRRS